MLIFLFFTLLYLLVGILLQVRAFPLYSHSLIDQYRSIKSYFSSCFTIHYYIIYFDAPIFPDLTGESPLHLPFWEEGLVTTILSYVQGQKTLLYPFALGVVRQHRNH